MKIEDWQFTNQQAYETARHRVTHDGQNEWSAYRKTDDRSRGFYLGSAGSFEDAIALCREDWEELARAAGRYADPHV